MFRKTATVNFYVVEPAAGQAATFTTAFPSDEVLDAVRLLDLASGDYHVRDGLFANEVFCIVHEGPVPILGAYNKDMYASVVTERKGEIREVEMDDGEGLVDASYVAFFPNSIAAIVRTSVKSPGSARIANWLSLFGGHPCYFAALPTADAMARLQQDPKDVTAVVLTAKKSRLRAIRRAERGVAEALEAVARVSNSTKPSIRLGVEKGSEKAAWWHGMQSVIGDLVEVLPEFDTARVEISRGRNVNLLDAYVGTRVDVELDGSRRIQPVDAARALVEAYSSESQAIALALASWRE
jgi:hypothetical protein